MTTPSSPISLSSLRAEFGGSTPDSLSEYYRGGGLVPDSQSTSSVDGTAISTSGLIRLGMFRNVTRVTYSVTPAASSVNEGSTVSFNVSTTGLPDGTTLYWTILHLTTDSSDFNAPTPVFSITANAGSFSIQAIADSTTEGSQSFQVQIRTGSTAGPVVATSSTVTINDTSTSGGVSSAFGGSFFASRLSSTTNATATVSFNTDGTVTGNVNPVTGSNGATGDFWYTPTTAGIGNSYWIRATVTAGMVPSSGPGQGTWLQLSANRSWQYSTSTGGVVSIRNGTVFFEISSNSSGTAIVASGTYDFYVERES